MDIQNGRFQYISQSKSEKDSVENLILVTKERT